jgi:hypothetical protein
VPTSGIPSPIRPDAGPLGKAYTGKNFCHFDQNSFAVENGDKRGGRRLVVPAIADVFRPPDDKAMARRSGGTV